MRAWDEVWRFNTARFSVIAEAAPCEEDPRDSLDAQCVAEIESGSIAWFDARVRVETNGKTIGADYLGCCAYASPRDVFRDHATGTRDLRDLVQRRARLLESIRRTEERYPDSVASLKSMRADYRKLGGQIRRLEKQIRNNAKLNPPVSYCTYGPTGDSRRAENPGGWSMTPDKVQAINAALEAAGMSRIKYGERYVASEDATPAQWVEALAKHREAEA